MEANAVTSTDYELKPFLLFRRLRILKMQLNFPSYLNKKSETIKGSGNAIVPEGTMVSWRINTQATQNVEWSDLKSLTPFAKKENTFSLSKSIFQNTDYQILTSNEKVKNYEKLNYQISVIKDQFPTINVNHAPDSLKTEKTYVIGQVWDHYGLSKLQVVYYEKDKPATAKRELLQLRKIFMINLFFLSRVHCQLSKV